MKIAYTQIETPLKGFVPLLGVYGSGLLLALTASLLAAGIKKQIKPSAVLIIVISLWGISFFARQ